MQRIKNCRSSHDTDRDWKFAAAAQAGLVKDEDPPETVNLREDWWPVSDQGDTGACVGFAMADGVLRYMYVMAGWIGRKEKLSPRFIWMADKETDSYNEYPTTFLESEGTYIKQAMRVARKYGCVLSKDLPMRGPRSKLSLETFYTRAARLRIATYHNLQTDLAVWRKWLAAGRPILARLEPDAAFDNASGRTILTRYREDTACGGHAVCIVGYTPKRFVIRNSWGRQWGEDGFAYATDAYVSAAFSEAYGAVL